MLILARKKDQQILFPNLGIEVAIQRISGNSVSLGINAPKSVQVLRGELANDQRWQQPAEDDSERRSREHELRNQLNKARLAVAIAQKQIEMRRGYDAEKMLDDLVRHLREIDAQLSAEEPSIHSTATSDLKCDEHAPQVLIVEDDDNERSLLAGYLRLHGFQINEARDGIEALQFLADHRVDLVVLDIRMPRMNGIDTIKEIRRQPALRNTKVVVVSGEDRDDSLLAEPNGNDVSDWFSKPLEPDQLVGHLSEAMS